MENIESTSKKIIKNTFFLYMQTCFSMICGFLATRELLAIFGVEDFGIVNLISSIVTLFTFLSGSIATAVSRFINVSLACGSKSELKETFNISLIIFVIITLVLISGSETVGLYFIKNHVNLPHDKISASIVFYHFAILGMVFRILSIPYNALLIAKENIGLYSLILGADSFMKLAFVFLLYLSPIDNIEFYGVLQLLQSAIIFTCYFAHTQMHTPELLISKHWNTSKALNILVFSAFTMLSNIMEILNNIAVNVMLNNFFGAAFNATRATANQVMSAAASLPSNVLTSTYPRIVSLWNTGQRKTCINLFFKTEKFGFFILYIIILPLFIEIGEILRIWLKTIPPNAELFIRLTLLIPLLDYFNVPIRQMAQAIGKIKLYNTVNSLIILLQIPIIYAAFKLKAPPEYSVIIPVITYLAAIFIRSYLLKILTGIKVYTYMRAVLFPIFITCVLSAIPPAILCIFMEDSLVRLFIVCPLSLVSCSIFIIAVGMTRTERKVIFETISARIRKTIG